MRKELHHSAQRCAVVSRNTITLMYEHHTSKNWNNWGVNITCKPECQKFKTLLRENYQADRDKKITGNTRHEELRQLYRGSPN